MAVANRAGTEAEAGGFNVALHPVLEPALAGTADQLTTTAGLGADERRAVLGGLTSALSATAVQLTGRLLTLELNAARVTGRLSAQEPAQRWAQFLHLAADPAFWHDYLPQHYPTLLPRLELMVRKRCAAAVALAQRFAADRADLTALLGAPAGELVSVGMGAGDSHGGHTVSIVRCTGGAVLYKPRPLDTDLALSALLAEVRDGMPAVRIDVAAVLGRPEYGWARLVRHSHCTDDAQQRLFYRGLGHWLAVMRLLGGTDLHAENLVACGPTPVIVDCETVFTPHAPDAASGLGSATDQAVRLVRAMLRTRLLPARRGDGRQEDGSAAGNLPDHQPEGTAPAIIDQGTDTARLGTRSTRPRRALNHPSPQPQPHVHWPQLLAGFDEVSQRLVELDRAGRLEPVLDRFRRCRVRVVARSTATYGELGWMLWHPVSLHDEPAAVRRATELMSTAPGEPHDPATVAAEIAELLCGDVPVFTALAGDGRVYGPDGACTSEPVDLVADALRRWRDADLPREREVARASVVSVHRQARCRTERPATTSGHPVPPDDLDQQRRQLAAALLHQVRDSAVRGEDDTAAWTTPVLGPGGWYVHACGPDLHGGAPGIAVLLAGYLCEVRHGRADPVPGLDELLDAILRTVRLREDQRPGSPRLAGGYLGSGGRIWSWLTLSTLPDGPPDALARASALAESLPTGDGPSEVLAGYGGAVVPLLQLAYATAEGQWVQLALNISQRLMIPADPQPGFAHGVTGVGWALARLASSGAAGAAAAARAADAFDHEECTYDADAGGWLPHGDPPSSPVAAWCHGAVGIGLAAADLLRRNGNPRHEQTLRRAAAATWNSGLGRDHTLCHGDLGAWELLADALEHGLAPTGLSRELLDARVLSGLRERGPVLPYDVPAPGLLVGIGGIAYQLLRMHPACRLPSALLLGDPKLGDPRARRPLLTC